MEADGYGAVLKVAAPSAEDQRFFAEMKALSAQPLSSFSTQWKTLPQSLVPIAETERLATLRRYGAHPRGRLHFPRERH